MKKTINIINLCLIISVLIGDVFYILQGSLWIKALTSAGFVLLGLINLVYVFANKIDKKLFIAMMFSGLLFAMLGDIFLEIEFIVGAALFAVGHVFFFIAYCTLTKLTWKDLLYGAMIFVPATVVILFVPIFDFGGILMQVVCVVYAIIISCMTGKAISNYIQTKNILFLLLMIGSVLFLFSDLMLLFNVFANAPRIIGILCLATYYPAECILAHSIIRSKK